MCSSERQQKSYRMGQLDLAGWQKHNGTRNFHLPQDSNSEDIVAALMAHDSFMNDF
jgi:hypothetical protein